MINIKDLKKLYRSGININYYLRKKTNLSEKAITYPPITAPIGDPIPPTIAAANIGNNKLKYVNELRYFEKSIYLILII